MNLTVRLNAARSACLHAADELEEAIKAIGGEVASFKPPDRGKRKPGRPRKAASSPTAPATGGPQDS